MISRLLEANVLTGLESNPVVAIIGPRQCGKTTLARHILGSTSDTVMLDLEKPSDLAKLENPELYFRSLRGKLICLDEIQRKPEIFPLIRSLVDEWGGNGHLLVLGSASVQLLKQSSESLAGRISYKRLNPFIHYEISGKYDLEQFLIRGGFPRALLAPDDETAGNWLLDFIRTYVERDLLQWGGVSSTTMLRLWTMLAHLNGQVINFSNLASSLGVSSVTVKSYVDLLANTYMVNMIPPFLPNIGKRLVKSPKIYLSDQGILAGLLNIRTYDDLLGHPVFGSLWESVVLNQVGALFPRGIISHYRTSHGNELDFILELNGKIVAIECKASLSPKLTKGNLSAIKDINPDLTIVVAPVDQSWPISQHIQVCPLDNLESFV